MTSFPTSPPPADRGRAHHEPRPHDPGPVPEPAARPPARAPTRLKGYLKIVDEKLAEREKKVVEQQKQVDLAQTQVDLATDELFQRKKDLEKLEMHKQ